MIFSSLKTCALFAQPMWVHLQPYPEDYSQLPPESQQGSAFPLRCCLSGSHSYCRPPSSLDDIALAYLAFFAWGIH